jgi:hypothetical protein
MFPSIESADRRFAFLHWVLRGEFPSFNSSIKALRLPDVHLAALRFLRLAIPQRSLVVFAPRRTSAPPKPGVGDPVSPAGISLRRRKGSPKFLRNLNCPFANVPIRRRQDCLHQTIKCSSVALGHRMAKAPTKGLSTLNSIAFGLAVYASQDGLLQHHARLASSCWSGSTRAGFPPASFR